MASDTVKGPSRRRPRLVVILTLVSLAALVFLLQLFASPECNLLYELPLSGDGLPDSLNTQAATQFQGVSFDNLNQENAENTSSNVLLLSLLYPSDVAQFDDFVKLIRNLDYPKSRLSIAFLLVNPVPTTLHAIRQHIQHAHLGFPSRFYSKTFDHNLVALGDEPIFELQPLWLSSKARARNYLLQTALTKDYDYVLWLEPSLSEIPQSLVQDLIETNADIVAPNVMKRLDGADEWGFDRRNWQETELSKSLHGSVPEDFVFMEGKFPPSQSLHAICNFSLTIYL